MKKYICPKFRYSFEEISSSLELFIEPWYRTASTILWQNPLDLNWFPNVTYLTLSSVCPCWPNLVRLLGAVNVRSKRKIRIPLSKEEIRQKGPKISHKRPLRPRLSSTKDTPSKIFLQSHILYTYLASKFQANVEGLFYVESIET